MQAPSPLWAQFPCLQTCSGSGLDHLAWKGCPISRILSISRARAQLASASQALEAETQFQVRRAHVPSARVWVGLKSPRGLNPQPWTSRAALGLGGLACVDMGRSKYWS